jgi:hypothetical protein
MLLGPLVAADGAGWAVGMGWEDWVGVAAALFCYHLISARNYSQICSKKKKEKNMRISA